MSQVKSIKCTNCAAPLDLLGGGRVESITCPYCKSVLDLNENYKVLSNFKNSRKLHKLPFEIGMKGQLNSIDYTIIGRVTYQSINYPDSIWTDFLLYSPLYGYAYLTYEDGHLIYSKRNRTFPNVTWSQLTKQSSILVNGNDYNPFDQYEAKVIYVEGELTWIAKRNDKTYFTDLVNPPHGISVEKTKNEIEYYEAKYLDSDEVYTAFNIEKQEKPKTFNALQPFERPFLKSLSYIAYWVLFIVALLTLVTYVDGSGKVITKIAANNEAVKHLDFRVKHKRYLVDLELQASTSKALNNFNLQIHKNKKIVFSLTPHTAYIFNETTGSVEKNLHPWEKDSKKVRVSLNLALGNYHLSIKPINPSLKSTLFVNITEASSRLNYLVWFFIFTTFSWILYKFYQWRHKLKVDDERGIDMIHDNARYSGSREQMTLYLIVLAIILILVFGE
ncbi:MAG: Unknown protein [uncultured Sulfurovum sp.]|uniref:DUF4178 domain-containing protein n=1 Tax=uncultured Sulfurovum sp. TaxID=269237 RepID=A0A6S6SSN4_9BACT|nr:MAG: Unknown protein [uncultured Sulfurovum sp.]